MTIFQDLVKTTDTSNKIGRFAQNVRSPTHGRTQLFKIGSESSGQDTCSMDNSSSNLTSSNATSTLYSSPKSSPDPAKKPSFLNLSPQKSPSPMRKSPSPSRKKRLSDIHVIDMNKKSSPASGVKKFKSPIAPRRRRGKSSVAAPDLSPSLVQGGESELGLDSGTLSSFKKATKASLKGFKYKRGISTEEPADDSEEESEKSSTSWGLNRQKSFTEATKKGLRRLSNAFKSGNDTGDDENQYVTPTNESFSDISSTSQAAAGAHPRSATVGMYVTPPTLERGAGGLHEILNAKKSLRKSESNQRW